MGVVHSTPTELLDQICSLVESPRDLLSLALSAKRLSQLVIPGHIEFRVLRCDFRRYALWKALISHPSLAARIRSLEIIPEGPDDAVLPKSIIPNLELSEEFDEQECLAQLAAAVRFMPQLTLFHWMATYRPINIIFDALQTTCGGLTNVEILNFDSSLQTSIRTVDFGNSPLWKLTDLTQFSLTERHVNMEADVHAQYTDAMVDMLVGHCPRLEDLQIFQNHGYHSEFPTEHIQRLFKTGVWPNLKRLSVEGISLDGHDKQFFPSHPAIERLCIRHGNRLDFSALSHLRSLHVDWFLKPDEIPADTASNLEHLAMSLPDKSFIISDNYPHCEYILNFANLRTLVLSHAVYHLPYLKELFACTPNVEKLALKWYYHDVFVDDMREDLPGFYEALALLPKLTHLSYIDPSLWVSEDDEADEEADEENVNINPALKALASVAPCLRFIEIGFDEASYGGNEWMTIERGDDGAYLSFAATGPQRENEVDVDQWGGCYLGAGEGLIDKEHW